MSKKKDGIVKSIVSAVKGETIGEESLGPLRERLAALQTKTNIAMNADLRALQHNPTAMTFINGINKDIQACLKDVQ